MPDFLVASIDRGIDAGRLTPVVAFDIVSKALDDSRLTNPNKWTEPTDSKYVTVFSKKAGEITKGDILVKLSPESNGSDQKYEAHMVLDPKWRLLGSEPTLEGLKTRVELFSTTFTMSERLNKAIELIESKEPLKAAPLIEKPKGKDRGGLSL
jgi:hypothetical protein